MMCSLWLFGFSVIGMFLGMIFDVFSSSKSKIASLILSRLSQDLEKAAIFTDITRLIMLVIALKSPPYSLLKRVNLVKLIFTIWMLFFIVVVIAEVISTIIYNKNSRPTQIWNYCYQLIYNYAYNCIVIMAYLILSVILYISYHKIKKSYRGLLTEKENK